jgi:hypothetical protein
MRIADALGDRTDMNIAVVNVPAVMAMVCGLAAGEGGHGPSLLRLACVWRTALQDSRLLNNARKVRNRFFVDGRRRLSLAGLPNLRQVLTLFSLVLARDSQIYLPRCRTARLMRRFIRAPNEHSRFMVLGSSKSATSLSARTGPSTIGAFDPKFSSRPISPCGRARCRRSG